MMPEKDPLLTLRLPARPDYLPVAVQYVETAAAAFGLGRNETLKISLAAEEIFAYLSKSVCPDAVIAIDCENGLYYVRVRFRFAVSTFNMKGLNITSAMKGAEDAALDDMGLMIASRSVDHLGIVAGKRNETVLMIEKEKSYPRAQETDLSPPPQAPIDLLEDPDAENLKQFALGVSHALPDFTRPLFFDYPGKVADMVAGGDYQAIVATAKRRSVGGILYHFRTDKIVEIFGPYVFYPAAEAETALTILEACLSRVARTRALGVLSMGNLPSSVAGDFESLGTLHYRFEKGEPIERCAYYRFLHEDPGCTVWTHSALHDYLDGEYRRLFLARDIRLVEDMGETRQSYSILSTEVRRLRDSATLRPLWPGQDFDANLERHIRSLAEDGLRNIFFEMDLGISWHAAMAPALLANRFKPRMLLPFAGQADVAVFQYHAPTEP